MVLGSISWTGRIPKYEWSDAPGVPADSKWFDLKYSTENGIGSYPIYNHKFIMLDGYVYSTQL